MVAKKRNDKEMISSLLFFLLFYQIVINYLISFGNYSGNISILTMF